MGGPMVVYSVVLDWLYRVTAVSGWLLLWWWGRTAGRRGRLPALWWAGCVVAVAATLRTVPATLVLDQLTGQNWLSVLLAHLLVETAAVIVVTVQVATRRPITRRVRCSVWAAALAAGVGLATSWWFATQGAAWPTTGLPAAGTAPVIVPPVLAAELHQVLFGLVVLTAAMIVGISVVRELVDTPPGPLRVPLGLAVAAAACATSWAAVQAGAAIAPAWGGGITTDMLAVLDLVVVGLAATLAAAAAVVYRMSLREIPHDLDRVLDELVELRDWLVDPETAGVGREDLFGLLIEVRDRMWLLQQQVSSPQLARAGMNARSMGLLGDTARAFTAAVALEVAMRNDPTLCPVQTADISRLGGGDDEEHEALWLAQVQRCRTTQPVSTAADWVLEHTAAGEMRPRATTPNAPCPDVVDDMRVPRRERSR